jgi:hypothetical protein
MDSIPYYFIGFVIIDSLAIVEQGDALMSI